ncbi:TetR/AcrR family transcriptional regulator [Verrucosispora sp. SN26_14.1]|uniref:TetR/AcrR family transcriptional regulator n=1 Tax=Verrucosispora sp. SN26_14.1 TaxID=2527879 RepID=UPI0010333A44|nr:TetR/AcrR family transcriptional regulator [Verrucosispora sp. SN26_14.1]TBL42781.1 TetR/AcrR family transcriptional regulator [Verrucosispora sp. SN26_14.1]
MQESVGSGRALRRDAQANRQRIIEAARQTFATRGVSATYDDVAQQAGVGVATVHRRFPTKESLLAAALEERLERHAAAIEAALHAPTGWDGLVRFLCRAAQLHATDRGVRDVELGTGFDERYLAQIRARIMPTIRQLVERARTEGTLRPDVTAEDIPVLLTMISEVAHHSQQVRPETYTRYLRLLIDGLRASPEVSDLGTPTTSADVDALLRQWLPGARRRP